MKILRAKIEKVKVGMNEKEVIEILGKPTHIQMAGGPYYWCYDTDSISQTFEDDYYRQIHCGQMLLEMWYSMAVKKRVLEKSLISTINSRQNIQISN